MATTETDIQQRRQGPPPITRDDVRDLFKEFISNRNMNPEQGGAQLMADNAVLREDKRRLKEDLKSLEAKVPQEGQVIVSAADAKLLTDVKGVLQTLSTDKAKQTVEELNSQLKERTDLSGKVASLEKDKLAVEIAEAEGWKVSTLLRLTQGMELLLEDVEEEVDDPENEGKKKKVQVKRGFITQRDASGGVTGKKKLSDELTDFLPSLAKEHGDGKDSDEERSNESGTSFVRQSRGDKATSKSTNVSKDFLKGRYGKTFAEEGKK